MSSHPDSDPGASSANYDLLDRLADEFAARFRRGERPSLKEYTDRYPDLADDIQVLFPALVDLEQADEVRQEVVDDSSGAEPPPPAPALAQVGDYRVLREIGHGGMGVVYEAEQVSLGRRVALKILPHHIARDPKMLERFRREARAAARLHHTNIVPVFEVGREADVCYYAMQFIQGQGLDLVYDELRRLRGRAKEKEKTRARSQRGDIVTYADRAAVGQVVHSLLTGRFRDDPLPVPTGTVAGPTRPEWPTLVFATNSAPEPALGRTEAGSATGDREKGSTPTPASVGHASLTASSAVSAVMPGGSQISTVESARRDYPCSIARIGLQAAQGLAYAHARGVIHRDIKPSNLLLDTVGVVWITDFGLAKADGDALTQTGDILGTLRYMAPERFSGTGDARADVYALGLTLYELLTLEPAFDAADRLRLIEQIKSVDPVRPRLLDRRLPRDLETVILKAIDKDARRRYQTADELAEDLRRFRDDEPILARRATAVERYARWARRNPGVAVLGGVLTAVLVLATVASLVVAGRMATLAERQRRTADSERGARLAESDARKHEAALRKQAEQARRDAEAALAETQVERNRAEENFQRARSVVDQYFTQVSESLLLSVPGLQTLRRDLLGSALSFYEDYLTRRGHDPALSSALAAVHLKAAKIHLELGDRAAAEKDYRGALLLYEALAQAGPTPEAWNGLAECHYGLATCGPAGKPRRDALLRSTTIRQELVAARPTDTRLREDLARSYQALGESQRSAKQVKEALDSFLKARDIVASLVGDHPDQPAYRHDFAGNLAAIAECLCILGRHQDETIVRPMAIDHARAAYEQAPQVVAYGRLYGHLLMREGDNLSSQGRYEDSIRSLQHAVQVEEKLIRENPAVPDLPRLLATTYIEIVAELPADHRPSESVPMLRQGCELLEALPLRGPDPLYALSQLLALRATKPEPSRPRDEDEARRRRDSDLAADALRRAIAGGFRDINELRKRARSYFPNLLMRDDVTAMLAEVEARVKTEALAKEANPAPSATPRATKAVARDGQKTPGTTATDTAHQRLQADLAASEHAIALIRLEMGKTLHAKGDFDDAVAEIREAIRLRPQDAAFRGQLDVTLRAKADRDDARAALGSEATGLKPDDFAGHIGLARKMVATKDLDGAVAEFREAIRIEPNNRAGHRGLAGVLRVRGDLDGALAESRRVARLTPGDPQAHIDLGISLKTKKDLDGALAEFREAVRLKPDHASARDWVGWILNAQGRRDEAVVEFREALRINPEHADAHRNLGGALLANGDKVGAIAEFRAAVQLRPDDTFSRNQLVDILKAAGDTAGAEAVLREANHNNLGLALEKKGDLAGAVVEYRAAIRIDGSRSSTQHNNLSRVLLAQNDLDGAVAEAREAVRLAPGSEVTHRNLGRALRGKSDWAGAAAAYHEAIRIKPDNFANHNALGLVLMSMRDFDGAIPAFRESIRLNPDYGQASIDLVAALSARRQRDSTLAAAVSGTSRRDHELARALDTLMAPLLTRIRLEEEIAVLDDLIREQPKQTCFRVGRARSLVELCRREEAAAEFAQALTLLPPRNMNWGADDPTGVYPTAVADPEVFEGLTRLRPRDANLWIARIRHLGRQREWRQAAAVNSRLIPLDLNAFAWLHEAGMLCYSGDREGYRQVCRQLLERFRTSTDLVLLRRAVLDCLLEPDAVAGLGELAPLVDRFAGTAPANRDTFSMLAAGTYEYRRGCYRAAIDRLQPLPEEVTTIAGSWPARATACVIRAMAFQKLNQGDEARRQLTVAAAQAKQANFDPDRPGPLPSGWNEWLRYQILRRQAEGLIRDAASPGESKGQ